MRKFAEQPELKKAEGAAFKAESKKVTKAEIVRSIKEKIPVSNTFAEQEAINRKERAESDEVLSEGEVIYDKETVGIDNEIAFAKQEVINKAGRDQKAAKEVVSKTFAEQEVINREERAESDEVLSEGEIIYDDETETVDNEIAFAKQELINKKEREQKITFGEQEKIYAEARSALKSGDTKVINKIMKGLLSPEDDREKAA